MRNLIYIIFGLIISFSVYGQDFFYSQYYTTPMITNPALTGDYKEDIRATFIHRSQWSAINTPFATSSFLGEINFKDSPWKFDMLGAGISFTNDNMPDNIFKNQTISLSGAAFKFLDPRRMHQLSIGLQTGVTFKNLNNENLAFQSQIQDFQRRPDLPSGENFDGGQRTTNIDFHAGANYDFIMSRRAKLQAGLAAFNIIRPTESYIESNLDKSLEKLGMRYGVNLALDYQITSFMMVSPSSYFLLQNGVQNFTGGAALSFDLSTLFFDKTFILYTGGYMRMDDAAILMAGLHFDHFKFTFSYDMTISGLEEVKDIGQDTNGGQVGSWEVSLTYLGFLQRIIPKDLTVPCRFF